MDSLVKKIHIKQFAIIIISVILILFSFSFSTTNADEAIEDDGGKDKVTKGYDEYAGENKYSHEVLGKFTDDVPNDREASFRYLFSRIVVPQYLNDVRSGVPAKKSDKTVLQGDKGSYFLCDKNSPKNLIGYNCNLPNFSAQLGQSIMRVLDPGGIENGERVSGKPWFNWGVPNGIPNNSVPVDPIQRTSKYTGLELFGYNMKYTDYLGEWDDIIPSTKARMLANFGLMDTLNLTGTAIWNGIQGSLNGLGEHIENLSWNPTTWLGGIAAIWEVGTSETFLTIIDSSDMNVATSHGWTRSGKSVGESFYNVRVLTDKEVMDAASIRIAKAFREILNNYATESPELHEVMEMESPPVFTYDPNLESEESKKARAAAEAENRRIDAENAVLKEGETPKPHVPIPPKKMVPEEEQFADWLKEDQRVSKGESAGINCSDSENYESYKGCWATKWLEYKKKSFNVDSNIVAPLVEKTKKKMMEDDPYSDPTKSISHYVCLDENGKTMMNGSDYVYLYTAENKGSKESINPKCLMIRPTLQAGYFGNGYESEEITDTRHISHYPSKSFVSNIPIIGSLGVQVRNGFMWLAKFNAELLNELLNLSFSSLMEKLGITTIIKESIKSFKNTIFYPLLTLFIASSALMMFWSAIQSRSAQRFFTSFLIMLLVFIFGVIIMEKPDQVITFVDEIPAKAEAYVAKIVLSDTDKTGVCSTDGDGIEAGIRSAQCNIWSALVYNPWVFGQFGVSTDQLDVTNMKNKNGDLVGNAEVNMGGGVKKNNWALYQLRLTTSGTITSDDPNNPIGSIDKNLYRLVDLQAGPDNGALSDSRYLDTWKGNDGKRQSIAIQAGLLSVFMLIVIGSLLLLKIEVTFVFSILLLGLPFMLLWGLTPKGKVKLLGYGSTLLSLFFKRIIITFMISLMLILLNLSVPETASNYTLVFIGSVIILGFFLMYKKEIFKLFHIDTQDLFAGEGMLSGNPGEIQKAYNKYMPSHLNNKARQQSAAAKGAISGSIGGAIGGAAAVIENVADKNNSQFIRSNGGFAKNLTHGMKRGMQSGRESNRARFEQREQNKLLRSGLDSISIATQVKNHVNLTSENKLRNGLEPGAKPIMKEFTNAQKYDENKIPKQIPLNAKTQRKIRKLINLNQKHLAKDSRTLEENLLHMQQTKLAISKLSETRDKELERNQTINKIRKPLRYRNNKLYHQDTSMKNTIDEVLINNPEKINTHKEVTQKNNSHDIEHPNRKLTMIKRETVMRKLNKIKKDTEQITKNVDED